MNPLRCSDIETEKHRRNTTMLHVVGTFFGKSYCHTIHVDVLTYPRLLYLYRSVFLCTSLLRVSLCTSHFWLDAELCSVVSVPVCSLNRANLEREDEREINNSNVEDTREEMKSPIR